VWHTRLSWRPAAKRSARSKSEVWNARKLLTPYDRKVKKGRGSSFTRLAKLSNHWNYRHNRHFAMSHFVRPGRYRHPIYDRIIIEIRQEALAGEKFFTNSRTLTVVTG
jgi:hypothetical protein